MIVKAALYARVLFLNVFTQRSIKNTAERIGAADVSQYIVNDTLAYNDYLWKTSEFTGRVK
jgi:hypothetical protein